MKKISTNTYLKLMATIKENCQKYLTVYDEIFSLDGYFIGTGIDLEEDVIVDLDSATMHTAEQRQRLEHQFYDASNALRDFINQIRSFNIHDKKEMFKLIYDSMYTFCVNHPNQEKLTLFLDQLKLDMQAHFAIEVPVTPKPDNAHQACSMFPPAKRYKPEETKQETLHDTRIGVN